MTIRTSIVVLSLVASVSLYAQDLKLSVTQKGKIGYKNANGEIVIKEKYDYGEPFAPNGLAKVGKGDKYGLINKEGKLVLPIKYEEIDPYSDKHPMRIKSGKEWGLINSQTGEIILKADYTYISPYNCYGLAWVNKSGTVVGSKKGFAKFMSVNAAANETVFGKNSVSKGERGIIDKYGKWRIEPKKYARLFEFSDIQGDIVGLNFKHLKVGDTLQTDCSIIGFSKKDTRREFGILDVNGQEIVDNKEYFLVSKPVNGMMRWWKEGKKKTMIYGYLDLSTNQEIEMGSYSTDMTKEQKKEMKDEIKGKQWQEYYNGALAKKDDMLALMQITGGTENSSSIYKQKTSHGDFFGTIAPVARINGTDTTWCFVDRTGKEVIGGFNWIKVSKGKNNENVYYACDMPDRYRIFTSNNEELFANMKIMNYSLPDSQYGDEQDFGLMIGNKWGLYSRNGETLVKPQYEMVRSSRYGMYPVKNKGKWGFIDRRGKVIVPAAYNDIWNPKEYNASAVWVQPQKDGPTYSYNIKKNKQNSTKYSNNFSSFVDGEAWAVPYGSEGKEGYLIDSNDTQLIQFPFLYKYLDQAKMAVKNNNDKPLSRHESNKLVLRLKRDTQKVKMDEIIPAEGWDF